MKAITLHQPWASLIAAGHKTVETRSWPTNVRGPICIHAGKKSADQGIEAIQAAFSDCPDGHIEVMEYLYNERFPLGAIVCVADVRDCFRMSEDTASGPHSAVEQALGDWKADRYGWILGNIERIEPVVARGAQGIWDVPDDVAQLVMNQTFNVGWA